jgi:hypothetical protein
MLDFAVLSNDDWTHLLDFLCLRVKLALKRIQQKPQEWGRLQDKLADEVVSLFTPPAVAD